VFICNSLQGKHLGVVTRTRDKTIRTYKASRQPVYYTTRNLGKSVWTGPIWVVEDPISAKCLPCAVALLGTVLAYQTAQDLLAETRVVCVALDPGAEEAAAEVIHRCVDVGLSAKFVPLACDIKDMPARDVGALVRAYS
jgi:hypothetical protein